MKNDKYQNAWDLVLRNNQQAIDVKETIGMDEKIICLYQDFVQSHYQDALEQMFPRLNDIFETDWYELAELYYEKFPPYAWDLNDLTKSFSFFLEGLEESFQIPPYMKELVRYELMEFFVFKDACDQKTNDGLLSLNTTLDLQQFEYNIAQWVKEMDIIEEETGSPLALRDTGPTKSLNVLAVVRNPITNLCVFTQLGGLEVAVIEVLKETNQKDELVLILKELIPNLQEESIDQSISILKKQKIII